MLWFINVTEFLKNLKNYLNTSYVMVHQRNFQEVKKMKKFKYILCYGSSYFLHSMAKTLTAFKYILCYGSSRFSPTPRPVLFYLNTSYVMVHRRSHAAVRDAFQHLNTSYVMVHLIKSLVIGALGRFKYILCYGSSL